MAKNLLAPRKHYISAYRKDVCIFHRGYDSLARAIEAFAEQSELARAGIDLLTPCYADADKIPDNVVFWKGSRKKPFAEFSVPRETKGAL